MLFSTNYKIKEAYLQSLMRDFVLHQNLQKKLMGKIVEIIYSFGIDKIYRQFGKITSFKKPLLDPAFYTEFF
jgi:hypothetical protein